jgi:ATP-dependent Clp endopeptidase proteolytic subunit ClpP
LNQPFDIFKLNIEDLNPTKQFVSISNSNSNSNSNSDLNVNTKPSPDSQRIGQNHELYIQNKQKVHSSINNGEFDSSTTRISVLRNNVYFYGDLTSETCEKLKNTLLELDFNGKLFKLQYGTTPPPINLHIQSIGGSLLDSLYLVDLVQTLDSPVNTYVDGYAASAASLISVVGEKRFMSKNSFILIHQLSSGSQGKYEEMDDNMKNLDTLMQKVKNIYSSHTNIPLETLEEILKHDIWLDADTCKKYGLIDEVI